ncbi:acyltransferase family protein [Actinoplanes teichomyceticus]|uniref:Peptidoglycan/LPS O-acetylase OafA/YrhL n=1 Tax=Actinoplanes teichomyceticus TaxID=1867 RepID=A0A561WI50_ACTTI|nr:acyltransferase [Actinoplanes teichomyceticus]TWG23525.1 peptidoglycan/LPS O-acetylase OafA/YrhL [Actinoplanes teichomyceticus]GIF16149.1 membrane protein [Actinoplanes teichomyceticus]
MRNRYLDLLRAIATVRVVIYHLTGWSALTIVFPAMSVMFALAGSLMAASLDRFGVGAVERRLRRLLPSLWVLTLVVAVPAMLIAGTPFDVHLLLWGFPLADPQATGWWMQSLSHAWYLRDFLWFVLLSPLLLPIFRRLPLVALLIPYVVLLTCEVSGARLPAVAHDLALYGGAWLLGFAHHDGWLRRIRPARLLGIAAALAGAGVAWTVTHPSARGYDLNDIPLGNALWSAAFVLVALSRSPMVRDHRVLTVLNSRALSIYLWHIPILVAVTQFGERHGLPITGPTGLGWRLAAVLVLLGAVLVVVGWVEDVAAGRRPVLLPGHRAQARSAPLVPAPAPPLPPAPPRPAPAVTSPAALPGADGQVAAARA